MRKRYILLISFMVLICIGRSISFAQDDFDLEKTGKNDGKTYGYLDGYIEGIGIKEDKGSTSSKYILPNKNEVFLKYKDELKGKNQTYMEYFYTGYIEGYNRGYRETNNEVGIEKKSFDIVESGLHDGRRAATVFGNMSGKMDYFLNRSNNPNRSFPTDSEIIKIYFLDRECKEYREAFLNGFKQEYENTYIDTFRKTNINHKIQEGNSAYDHGRLAGLNKAKIIANEDYNYNRFDSDRTSKLDSFTLYSEHELGYRPEIYRDSFMMGYEEGFTYGYDDTYGNLIKEDILKKTMINRIPIDGGKLISADNILSINIENGTYCDNIAMSIEKLYNNMPMIDDLRYMGASGVYDVRSLNQNYILNANKTIELSFRYYGKDNGGIYKLVDGKWIYMNSKVKDNNVVTYIDPKTLRTGENIYRVLVDNQFKPFTDISYHWAQGEINTFLRRNIIHSNTIGKFFPNENITFAELIEILKSLYGNEFIDVLDYGDFEDSVPLSYKDIEFIMIAVLGDVDFRWNYISERMLYDKQIKSKSYADMENKITRAEVVYMLYSINTWRY